MSEDKLSPNWDRLFEAAVGQEGHFTTKQAAEAGYSPQLLLKYLNNGRVTRVRRGVYRIVHYPAGEHEDLAAIWLWSDKAAVFSHETALMLHDLSDALPSKAHLTVPADWAKRRLRVPKGVRLHYGDIPRGERVEIGAIPVTRVRRTLLMPPQEQRYPRERAQRSNGWRPVGHRTRVLENTAKSMSFVAHRRILLNSTRL